MFDQLLSNKNYLKVKFCKICYNLFEGEFEEIWVGASVATTASLLFLLVYMPVLGRGVLDFL